MYPIALQLAGRAVLVVGGGAVAARRVGGLLHADAHVTVVAPHIGDGLAELASASRIIVWKRAFQIADLERMQLVFACTNDEAANAAVREAAKAAGIFCNDARAAELGDFTVPAVHRSGPITFTVDTQGSSPSFAKRLRDEIHDHFGSDYGRAALTLSQMREIVKATIPLDRRSSIMERLASMPVAQLGSMHLGEIENAVEEAHHEDLDKSGGFATFATESRVCATRASALALMQSRLVTAKLARQGIASTLLHISSTGDRVTDRPISEVGVAVFTTELEEALREKRADYAVHSCKDLPGRLPEDLCIAAITERVDARDMFCSDVYASFAELPIGARIGTSSPRRRAQLLAMRPDLHCVDLRGNIDTRIKKLGEGGYDAIVLAAAGLERLQIRSRYMQPFAITEMVPAVGQGALAIETRIDDAGWITQLHESLTHVPTELAVIAERAFLAQVRGGCHAPIGAHAYLDATRTLHFHAIIVSLDGTTQVAESREVSLHADDATARAQAERLGKVVARNLLQQGGQAILEMEKTEESAPLRGRRLILGRTQERASRIAAALREIGAEVIELGDGDAFDAPHESIDAILFPSSGSVAVVAAHTSALFHASAGTLIMAMGPASAQAASEAGFIPHAVSPKPDIGSFVHMVTTKLLGMPTKIES